MGAEYIGYLTTEMFYEQSLAPYLWDALHINLMQCSSLWIPELTPFSIIILC